MGLRWRKFLDDWKFPMYYGIFFYKVVKFAVIVCIYVIR